MSVLRRKPDQGKVFDLPSWSEQSLHADRSVPALRGLALHSPHAPPLKWGASMGRRYQSETLPHVLCHCGPHSAARQLRHNAIVERLAAASRLPGGGGQCVPGVDGDLAALRPDSVITHEPSRTVIMIDVTVAFENKFETIEKARLEKVQKYQPLADALARFGHVVHVDGFVVGALGAWHPNNDNICKLLRILQNYASLMRKLIVSETIAWSRDVYVEHVSGIRQYCVQESAARKARPRALTSPNNYDFIFPFNCCYFNLFDQHCTLFMQLCHHIPRGASEEKGWCINAGLPLLILSLGGRTHLQLFKS
ncbi:unnamed protein product [Heterotrigona itama]|uniref:Uncharacterized protein n=1 Tax=Heterotrigona itama TaxID=395501 RepID=A0A6V7GZH8_9HYME|nr:unnamed protein product [Heterotrigona itama]